MPRFTRSAWHTSTARRSPEEKRMIDLGKYFLYFSVWTPRSREPKAIPTMRWGIPTSPKFYFLIGMFCDTHSDSPTHTYTETQRKTHRLTDTHTYTEAQRHRHADLSSRHIDTKAQRNTSSCAFKTLNIELVTFNSTWGLI